VGNEVNIQFHSRFSGAGREWFQREKVAHRLEWRAGKPCARAE
jgi:hypothetical protein